MKEYCYDDDSKSFDEYANTLSLEQIRKDLIKHEKMIQDVDIVDRVMLHFWILERINILKKYERIMLPSQDFWGI